MGSSTPALAAAAAEVGGGGLEAASRPLSPLARTCAVLPSLPFKAPHWVWKHAGFDRADAEGEAPPKARLERWWW